MLIIRSVGGIADMIILIIFRVIIVVSITYALRMVAPEENVSNMVGPDDTCIEDGVSKP